MNFRLDAEAWIPTEEGSRPLLDVIDSGIPPRAPGPLEHVALMRFLLLLVARAEGQPQQYLKRHRAGLNLLDPVRPFLQLPHSWTAALAPQSIAVIQLARVSGRNQTLFSRDLDARPRSLTPAQAAVQLLTYQQFSPSNGKSAWGHTFDAPLARTACFLAEGERLSETLLLNAPEAPSPPIWEVADPGWQTWRGSGSVETTPATALAFPWLSVTLEPALQLTQVRLAGGPRGLPGLDPHAHLQRRNLDKPEDAADNPPVPARNPADRCAAALLARALIAALTGETAGVPVGFVRAARQGAARARITVLSTRTGQPVIQDVLEVVWPWPTVLPALAVSLLRQALESHERLGLAARRIYLPLLGGRSATDAGNQAGIVASYWSRLTPTLALALTGQASSDELKGAAEQAAEESLRDVLGHLGTTEAQRAGQRLAVNTLRQTVDAP